MKLFKSIVGLSVIILVTLMTETSATSDYIHEKVVNGVNTISICDPNDGLKCLTIQNRNLGASTTDITSTGSYGYHFQRGNNHGFAPCYTEGCSSFSGGDTYLAGRVDTTGYGPGHRYDSNVFRQITSSPWDRSVSENRNLWGGSGDLASNNFGYPMLNPEDRKGPCDSGYHVPSIGEWSKLLEYWILNNNSQGYNLNMGINTGSLVAFTTGLNDESIVFPTIDRFLSDFNIPYDGVRDYYDNRVIGLGWAINLTTSSVCKDFGYRCVYTFAIYSNSMNTNSVNDTAGATPIRCFKNVPEIFPKIVEAQLNLSILKGTLTIGTETGNLNLGEVNVSNNNQTLSGSFGANSFWVEDMKGVESGYYTTISVTDLTGSVATHVIPATNVSLKTAGDAPNYISGSSVSESLVVFGDNIKSWHSNWTAPVTYFHRENTPSNLAGRVGKWGDNLQVKINVPAHTPSDIYRGTITYTLYDMDTEN